MAAFFRLSSLLGSRTTFREWYLYLYLYLYLLGLVFFEIVLQLQSQIMAEGFRDFIAGTVGGFSGKLFDYPFDTVKVLLQTQNSLPSSMATATAGAHSAAHAAGGSAAVAPPPVTAKAAAPPPVYRGALHCLSHTVETQGALALYRGLPAPLLGSMAENAVLFLSYGRAKKLLGEDPAGGEELRLWQLATAGGMAGAVVSFVLQPFELIKVQMQVTNSSEAGATRRYRGVVDCLRQTIRHEGVIKGLFRGQTSLLLREIPGNFCWYGVYEGVCTARIPEGGTKRDLGTATHLLGGGAAGVAYWTAFYPADTVGSQLRANPDYATRSFADVFRRIYRKEGWRGLYRGWGLTALRAAPAHALIFAAYERTLGALRRWSPAPAGPG